MHAKPQNSYIHSSIFLILLQLLCYLIQLGKEKVSLIESPPLTALCLSSAVPPVTLLPSLRPLALVAEVQLDFLKQKGAIKRTLFLHNHLPHLTFPFVIRQQRSLHCQDFSVYLRVSFLEIISGASHIGIQIPTISI